MPAPHMHPRARTRLVMVMVMVTVMVMVRGSVAASPLPNREQALATGLAAYRGAGAWPQPTVTRSVVRRCALGRACARFPKVTVELNKCTRQSPCSRHNFLNVA